MKDSLSEQLNRIEDMLGGFLNQQGTILVLLKQLLTLEKTMSAELDALTLEVQATTTLEASAITMINGLAAQIASLKTDPVALQALSDQLTAKATDLAAAIASNTPPPLQGPAVKKK